MSDHTNIGSFDRKTRIFDLNNSNDNYQLSNKVAESNGRFFRNLTFFAKENNGITSLYISEGGKRTSENGNRTITRKLGRKLSKNLSLALNIQLASKIFATMKNTHTHEYLKIDITKNLESIMKKGFFEKIFGFVPNYKKDLRTTVEKMKSEQDQFKQDQLKKLESLKETIYNQIKNEDYTKILKNIFVDEEIKSQISDLQKSFKDFREHFKNGVDNKQLQSLKEKKASLLKEISTKIQDSAEINPQLNALLFLSVIDIPMLTSVETHSNDITKTVLRSPEQQHDCNSAEEIFPESLDIIKAALDASKNKK